MKAKSPRTSLDRCSRTPSQLMVRVQTEEYYRKFHQLPEPPLRLKRGRNAHLDSEPTRVGKSTSESPGRLTQVLSDL
jgi:hypothetical protein